MLLQEMKDFLDHVEITDRKVKEAGLRLIHELSIRLELLIDIGLEYLNMNRRWDTLSGGESQRIAAVNSNWFRSYGDAICFG